MNIPNYSCVQLVTDRYREHGVEAGDVGYVIEVYDDGDYEVEFIGAGGVTTAQLAVRHDEVKLAEPAQEAALTDDVAA